MPHEHVAEHLRRERTTEDSESNSVFFQLLQGQPRRCRRLGLMDRRKVEGREERKESRGGRQVGRKVGGEEGMDPCIWEPVPRPKGCEHGCPQPCQGLNVLLPWVS